jgi:predicted DNA-binding transcriptional regulator YafY
MEVGGLAELRTWVLSFGGGAEVLEPEALRTEVAAELAEALARYGRGARRGPRAR